MAFIDLGQVNTSYFDYEGGLRRNYVKLDPSDLHKTRAVAESFRGLNSAVPRSAEEFTTTLTLDYVDVVTFNAENAGVNLRSKHVSHALRQGMLFEISYEPLLEKPPQQQRFLNGVITLISMAKGRGIILSSGGAKGRVRDPYDVMHLGCYLGLTFDQARDALTANPASAKARAVARYSTFHGTASLHTNINQEATVKVK